MIKAILLVFDPAHTWQEIIQDRRGIPFVFCLFLLPLLALTGAAEGYGLHTWGKWLNPVAGIRHYNIPEIAVYEILQILLSLVVVLVGAKLLKATGETFHGRHTYTQTFLTVAYGLSPLFTLRLLDLFPSMPWALTWAVGVLFSLRILYHGVPLVMEPDPAHAFGLYVTSGVLLAITSGLGRFLSAWWIEGKFEPLAKPVNDFVKRLLS